ncbi:MAG TPA: hypothetical protein VHT96_10675 [Clostridia bacterium]|nr:hypothetical protein [Clostridia bacterium]
MGNKSKHRRIVERHAGETGAAEIGLKILKLLSEDHERGIVKSAGDAKHDRGVRKDQPG